MKKFINLFTLGVFLISNIMTPLTNFIYAEENEALEESGDLAVVRDMEDVENSNENIPESSPEETVDNSTGEENLPAVEPATQPEGKTEASSEDLPESTESHNSAVTPVEDEEDNNDTSAIQGEQSIDEDREIMGTCPAAGQIHNDDLNITYSCTLKNNVPVYYGTDMDSTHRYNNNPIGTITVFVPIDNEEVPITMMDMNLGATISGVSLSSSVMGKYFQWGNNYGFAKYPETVSNINNTKVDYKNYWPGNSYTGETYITQTSYWNTTNIAGTEYSSFPVLWGGLGDTNNTASVDTLYGGIKNGRNRQGPCPDGYHVPSLGEWNALMVYWDNTANGSQKTYNNTSSYFSDPNRYFSQAFLLPRAERRDWSSSNFGADSVSWNEGYIRGYYMNSSNSTAIEVKYDTVNTQSYAEGFAESVRCFKDSPDAIIREVTFHGNGGNLLSANSQGTLTQLAEKGQRIQRPVDPTNDDGSEFLGWTKTLNGTDYFDFSTPVEEDINLYAKWKGYEFNDLELYFLQEDGTLTHYTIMDRNMGATEAYNQDYDNQNSESFGSMYDGRSDRGTDNQGPCPNGYHVPSIYEWNDIYEDWTNSNSITTDKGKIWASNLLLPSTSISYYGYGGWYRSSTSYDSNSSYSLYFSSSDIYIYTDYPFGNSYKRMVRCAKSNANDKTLNIHGDTGIYTVVAFTGDIGEGKITALGIPSSENYIFRGWYSDANYQHEVNVGDTVPSDLYAKWEALELYTITYVDPLNATNNNPTIYNVTTADITLTNLFKDDNTNFEGWYTDAEYQNKVTGVAIAQGSTGERTFYAKWSCKKGFVMEGGKCVFPGKMATLIEGPEFNATLKSLAGNSYGNYTITDTKIKGFVWRDSLPEGINPEDIEKISIDGSSDVPVYAWFDQTGYSNGEGIIYYTSEADKIYMNQLSAVMFYNMQGLTSLDLSNLDTSKVTNMSSMFYYCSNLTSLNLDNRDLSKLGDNYGSIFYGASSLKTLSVKNWIAPSDVQQLLSSYKASLSAQLDRIDVSGWDLRNTTSLYYLFGGNHTKEIIGLNTWDTSNITDMSQMFYQCDNIQTLDISNFDTSNVTTMYLMFYGSSNLKSLDLSNFDTSNLTNMNVMFNGCSSLKSLNLDNWDLSKMSSYGGAMFYGVSSLKTLSLKNWVLPENASSFVSDRGPGLSAQLDWIDVSGWDLSKTTNLYGLFGANQTKKIIGLDTWDTSNVKNMKSMFQACTNLTELDLSSFDISNVTSMEAMFAGCSNLTSLKLDNWNLSKSPSMGGMFQGTANLKELSLKNWIIPTSFHQILSADTSSTSTGSFLTAQLDWIDVSGWDLSQTTDISGLFKQSNTKAIIGMDTWDTSNIIDMGNLFNGCANLTSLNLDNWYLVNIDAMINIFQGTSGLKTLSLKHWVLPTTFIYMLGNYPTQLAAQLDWIDVSDWDLSHTTTIEGLFADSYTKKIIGMDTWDTSNLQSMRNMFLTAPNLTKVDVSNWDLSNLTDVSAMFKGSNISEVVGINTWKNTSNITNMADMFKESRNLKSVDFGNFDASGVQTMNNMFNECDGLTTLDLGGIDTRNVKNMSAMFAGSDNLEEIDLSSWNTESVTNMLQMFVACPKLKTIYATDKFSTTNTTVSDAMFFLDTVLVGGKGTTYTESHTNKEYARIDEGTSNPGYFTKANTITYNLNGGERESGNEGRTAYSPLSSFTLPTPVREGYTFIGWTGSNGKKPKKEVKIQEYTYGDLTYTANWEINNYKIIFDTDGGNEIAPIEVEYNSVLSGIELPSPTKECNGFAGWDKELPETMPAEDITLKAVWNYVCREYSGGGGGGGGGGSSSAIDVAEKTIDNNKHNAADERGNDESRTPDGKQGDTDSSVEDNYSPEFIEAYNFAKSNGITTQSNIQKAKMNSPLTRIAMAKMLSYYAINVLGQEPDMSKTINFVDVSAKRDAEYDNGVTLAYQLGIMGINMKNNRFRPNDEVTRAEFVTALSRMIYGMKDGTGKMKYYEPHMARMYNEGIINNTDPKMKEKRGYVMIMLMRTVK